MQRDGARKSDRLIAPIDGAVCTLPHITWIAGKFRHKRASEQTACRTPGRIGHLMQELLQQLDPDYYSSALLLVVRAELERLRQERSTCPDVEIAGSVPLDTAPSAGGGARGRRTTSLSAPPGANPGLLSHAGTVASVDHNP